VPPAHWLYGCRQVLGRTSVTSMKLIILLDVDGVLNPKVHRGDGDSPDPQLSDLKVALVRRLATKGRIAWVSTRRQMWWPV
jgi:hypothetical protein